MIEVIEQKLTGDHGSATVRREQIGTLGSTYKVVVNWGCTTREFDGATVEKEIIGMIDLLAEGDDVWVRLEDRNRKEFYVTLENGELIASEQAPRVGDSLPWKDLKKLIRKAAKG